ncbi:MAG: MDR family oxidoreductase [Bordetella sp.]|jgi:acrylyl-CoA reductase (NADPH)
MFRAIVLTKSEDEKFPKAALQTLDESVLPTTDGSDVLVQVEYSTLNYKDGLAITGRSPVVRRYPMVPGIDFAGKVLESADPSFKPGDEVILNGWGVGEGHWGGLAEKARVKGDWLIHKPKTMTSRQAMAIGTAGYTATLCVQALERHGLSPDQGEVLVTGAAGGVGSVAIAILAHKGFKVVASTGRLSEEGYLKGLGAQTVIDRAELSAPGKPLQKERWAAVVDSVGSHTLANACASTQSWGAVAACGLAQGMDFLSSVAPFILRGVTLYGINSVTVPRTKRDEAWRRLAQDLPMDKLESMIEDIGLEEAIAMSSRILDGQVRGRLAVKVHA